MVKSLKDKIRHHHNVSVAETDYQKVWQLSELTVVTVASSRQIAENTLRDVEEMAARQLAGGLNGCSLEWLT